MRRLLGVALSAWAVTATAQCLFYERPEVTLAGVVHYRAFSVADKAQSATILELESPICVRSRQPGELGTDVPRDNIRIVQLVLLPSISRPLPESRIAASGILSGADAGHHQTRVLLYVRTVNAAYESK